MLRPRSAVNTPSVVLAAPQASGECSSLIVDVTGSTGSVGRQWENVTLSVLSSNATHNTMLPDPWLQNYVDSSFSADLPLTIPASLLSLSENVQFSRILCRDKA